MPLYSDSRPDCVENTVFLSLKVDQRGLCSAHISPRVDLPGSLLLTSLPSVRAVKSPTELHLLFPHCSFRDHTEHTENNESSLFQLSFQVQYTQPGLNLGQGARPMSALCSLWQEAIHEKEG
jgi:hypothetical protein